MEEKLDNIYIYLWEEFNTVYVGRTKNPKSRHYAHKTRESERTYKFSHEHHVEHPKMVIIESNLTVEEGVEREKFWISHYRNDDKYNVLNKLCGGQIGNQHRVYTDDEMKEHRKKYYQSNKDSKKAYQREYYSMNREKIKAYFTEHSENKKAYDREYQKKWYEANKEKKKESHRKWCEANKDKIREYARKRRKTKKNEIVDYS